MILIKRYRDDCGSESKMMEKISDDGFFNDHDGLYYDHDGLYNDHDVLYDDHDGVNTSFELSHPEPVLSIGDNIGEGGHMVELTIPGEKFMIMTMITMIMKTMMIII